MISPTRHKDRSPVVLLGLCLVVIGLAGCTEPEEDVPVDMEAFQEALDAPGETFTPDSSGGTDFRVKLLRPEDPQNVPVQNRPLEMLLYDGSSQEPVVDVTISMETWMPEHNHECGPTQVPEHQGNGIYEGRLHVIMPGQCDVTLEGERRNGDSFDLVIEMHAPEE